MPDNKPARAANSASSLHRRFLCPGSGFAERDLPEEDTDDAKEGTLLHYHDENPDISRDVLTHEQRSTLDKNKGLRDRFLAKTPRGARHFGKGGTQRVHRVRDVPLRC
jgi:hypothetical protein